VLFDASPPWSFHVGPRGGSETAKTVSNIWLYQLIAEIEGMWGSEGHGIDLKTLARIGPSKLMGRDGTFEIYQGRVYPGTYAAGGTLDIVPRMWRGRSARA